MIILLKFISNLFLLFFANINFASYTGTSTIALHIIMKQPSPFCATMPQQYLLRNLFFFFLIVLREGQTFGPCHVSRCPAKTAAQICSKYTVHYIYIYTCFFWATSLNKWVLSLQLQAMPIIKFNSKWFSNNIKLRTFDF